MKSSSTFLLSSFSPITSVDSESSLLSVVLWVPFLFLGDSFEEHLDCFGSLTALFDTSFGTIAFSFLFAAKPSVYHELHTPFLPSPSVPSFPSPHVSHKSVPSPFPPFSM